MLDLSLMKCSKGPVDCPFSQICSAQHIGLEKLMSPESYMEVPVCGKLQGSGKIC